MNYKITATPRFAKDFKSLLKKYSSLKSEIEQLINSLQTSPQQGTPIGNNCYKIRLVISSKGKGKSGGARVITCVRIVSTTVFLLTIYDKSDKKNITNIELQSILNLI